MILYQRSLVCGFQGPGQGPIGNYDCPQKNQENQEIKRYNVTFLSFYISLLQTQDNSNSARHTNCFILHFYTKNHPSLIGLLASRLLGEE